MDRTTSVELNYIWLVSIERQTANVQQGSSGMGRKRHPKRSCRHSQYVCINSAKDGLFIISRMPMLIDQCNRYISYVMVQQSVASIFRKTFCSNVQIRLITHVNVL